MNRKLLRQWKKVFLDDLKYISYETKELCDGKAVIFLEGDLGSGKTTFSKIFIGEEETFSPSYSILQETKSVLHGDFYRLKSREDILHLELAMYLDRKQYFLCEWGEQYFSSLESEIPEDFEFFTLKIELENKKDSRNFALYSIEM
jgi:tRNA threonylcarbamoyladenosine biosynthesis protein TsaE